MTAEVEGIETEYSARSMPFWRRSAEAWARACTIGQLTLIYPNGESRAYRGSTAGPSATIRIHRGRVVWRLMTGGEVGFAEAYMDGDWSSPDLAALLEFALRNEAALAKPMRASWLVHLIAELKHRLNKNSRSGARKNIAYHYDLGNDFYKQWLDETMTYSSAVFSKPSQSLADAQREKYRTILRTLDVKPGERILEIGCGWGGFAELAAGEAGAKVTSITLSKEQAKFARERIAKAGLSDRAEILITDYRDTTGSFDKIVSIEMFEAVGEEHWPAYFDVVRERLVDGGRALLQIITVPDERFETYRRTIDFIQRYIFPGGMLPSPGVLSFEITRARLELAQTCYFATSYAETLRQWNEVFQSRWEPIKSLGFDERFRRMWTYYLNSCEACFRSGATDVGQFLLLKP